MSHDQLFDKAYELCVICNSHAISHHLSLFNKVELIAIVNFLTQLHRG
jgi:hypothetical protein